MNRCLSIVQNTGTKWRQELAKMRGLPDPTVKNDGANNSQNRLPTNRKKTANYPNFNKKIKSKLVIKNNQVTNLVLFQASPINSTSDVPAPSNDKKVDSEKTEKTKEGVERLQKDIAI